ncbi:MAG: fructose-6-phosphate aldolase [Rickettsiales bacterium]|nr:fructose-6-phosphate aldolase [Rickettsiales bacterium]
MKFFIDTANIEEIKELNQYGILDGVTTNPSLVAKSGRDFIEVITEICQIVAGPVSAEVVATNYNEMVKEADKLAAIADNVVIKLPMTLDGLKTCNTLSQNNIKTNVTLCFSAAQALLAAKAGATYVSPFIGRLDDISTNGLNLISEIRMIFDNYPILSTEILAASIRHPVHLLESAKLGADVATIPAKVIHQLIKHPLTDSGLKIFQSDWDKTGQKIA